MPERTASAMMASTAALTTASMSAKPDGSRRFSLEDIESFIDAIGSGVESNGVSTGLPAIALRVGARRAAAGARLAAVALEHAAGQTLDRERAAGRGVDRDREGRRAAGDGQVSGPAERGLDLRQVGRDGTGEGVVVLVVDEHRLRRGQRRRLGVGVLRLGALGEEAPDGDR